MFLGRGLCIFHVAFQSVCKMFQRQEDAQFIVMGAAVLQRILPIVDHRARLRVLQFHLNVPDGGIVFGLSHFLLDGIRQFVNQQQAKVLVVVVLHHVHAVLVVTVIFAVAGGQIHLYLVLL